MDEEDLAVREKAFLQRMQRMEEDDPAKEYPKKLTILFARHPKKGINEDARVTAKGLDQLIHVDENFGEWLKKQPDINTILTSGNYHFEASVLRRSQIQAVTMRKSMETAGFNVNKPFFVLDILREKGNPALLRITAHQSWSKFERKSMGQGRFKAILAPKDFPKN